ncbi:arylamine N-acetyltransferase family protein [Paraburkholderia sp. BCC1886]|uniref:arylamine N-acetyltransferase family protein n=1 Tax=Paraburkholderia sp. BCC1886 TaxID=2562670 RepID=UPI00118291F7|nr:arylamine N-acetyltransferase [Paraburkholderia sp. BCC1886]
MSHTVNLDHYFARIGYEGPRAATLDVLRDLHRLHPEAIPFENLNPLARRAVKLEIESIEAKLVDSRRGGYCFEQNALFANVLMQLGFQVTPLLGRVMWGREPDAIPPRTHMVLRVDLGEDAWLVDVGFGGVTLTEPLRLVAGMTQTTRLGTFRLADASRGALDLEVQAQGEGWLRTYRVELHPVEWIDYETSNWYTSSAPDSIFLSHLIVCRALPGSWVTLFDNQLNERGADGIITREQQIDSASQLAACLRDEFGLTLGDLDIDEIFERLRAVTNAS